MTIVEAVREGQLAGLKAMRDKLASDMDRAEPAVVAQIAGRLQAVLSEIAELTRGSEAVLSDVLAERRAARVATAKSSVVAGARRHK